MPSTVPNVSLVAEAPGPDQASLVVGDTRFPLSAAEFARLGFRGDRVRLVPPGTLARFTAKPIAAGPPTRPSEVFYDCGTDGSGPLGSWTYNCQASASIVQREVLVAGWLAAAHGEEPDSPSAYVAANGVEDVHYNLDLDPVFVDRMYGPGGLSLRLDGVAYPGNPPDAAPLPFAAGPPEQPGGPPTHTFNSWVLPGSGKEIHGELNSWHTRNSAGWFRRHIVGRGAAPAGWVNPLREDDDAWFPFDPFNPDGGPRRLAPGDYVLMRGPLWEDHMHGGDPWDVGPTWHHGWLEMHPIDWVVRVRGPQPNARVTRARARLIAATTPGDVAAFDAPIAPDFAPSTGDRTLQVREVRTQVDARAGMTYTGPVVLRTAPATDHVDIGATVTSSAAAGQGRLHATWLIEWSELDRRDQVWVDDDVPPGARELDQGEGWQWSTAGPRPFLGARSHVGGPAAGIHQHYFSGAPLAPAVAADDVLFATAWLDPEQPPDEVMLQWFTDGWEHRAFWGADLIPWGVAGTASRSPRGPLPFAAEWVRLEVPAAAVGVTGTVGGLAFTASGGRVVWDRAGVWVAPPPSGQLAVTGIPSRLTEGRRTVTARAVDSGNRRPVAGRVEVDGVTVGATNAPFTRDWEPGRPEVLVVCPDYPAVTIRVTVTPEGGGWLP